ncbi:MAG: exosortase C-terminal domain/associated protein EpsI, partial [Bryobacteraceae bacterium]
MGARHAVAGRLPPGERGRVREGMRSRFLVTAILLTLTMAAARSVEHRNRRVPIRERLADMPATLGEWSGTELTLLPSLAAAAGVDDYLYRRYADPEGNEIETYVGYYQSQSSGKLIHSPKHCLPGTGWQPVRTGLVS